MARIELPRSIPKNIVRKFPPITTPKVKEVFEPVTREELFKAFLDCVDGTTVSDLRGFTGLSTERCEEILQIGDRCFVELRNSKNKK